MRVVSTVHKAGFDLYGKKWLDGIKNWPAGTEFILYTEGFDLKHPGVTVKRIESIDRCVAFKEEYKHYKALEWRWDVVRFCNKMYAAFDALYSHKGIGVWLDADAITYKKVPKGYVEKLLPADAYLALFKRIGHASETGFWVMNCDHQHHQNFLNMWIRWLEDGSFKGLQQWCDNSMLDATIRIFEREGLIKTANLSGKHENYEHPMSKAGIAEFIDHLKGEERKEIGQSVENEFRRNK